MTGTIQAVAIGMIADSQFTTTSRTTVELDFNDIEQIAYVYDKILYTLANMGFSFDHQSLFNEWTVNAIRNKLSKSNMRFNNCGNFKGNNCTIDIFVKSK